MWDRLSQLPLLTKSGIRRVCGRKDTRGEPFVRETPSHGHVASHIRFFGLLRNRTSLAPRCSMATLSVLDLESLRSSCLKHSAASLLKKLWRDHYEWTGYLFNFNNSAV